MSANKLLTKTDKRYVKDSSFASVKIEINKLTLFFEFDETLDKDYESAFRHQTFLKYKKITRICILGLMFSCILLIFTDKYYLEYNYTSFDYLFRNSIRLLIEIPLCLIWYYLISPNNDENSNNNNNNNNNYKNKNNKNKFWSPSNIPSLKNKSYLYTLFKSSWNIATIISFLISLCLLGQTIISKEPDQEIYMLYFFMVYLFMGIPFFYGFIITWSIVVIFVITMWFVLQNKQIVAGSSSSFQLSVIYLCMSNGLLTIAAYGVERSDRQEYISGLELDQQESIVKELLDTLLPHHVTEQLRERRMIISEQISECSILFSDLVSFTKWASKLRADVLIMRLHELYTRFDKLCDDHEVYKVETIGDAYFISSNCPIEASDHADRLVLLGRSMMLNLKSLDWDGYTPRMRIGIHSGPVMGGVVGTKMPRYHLFGKTVMIAEHMESSGKPEMLHVTEKTKSLFVNEKDYKLIKRDTKIEVLGEYFQTYLIQINNTYSHLEKNNQIN